MFEQINHVFFREGIVFDTMLFQGGDVFLKFCHVFFRAHRFDDVVAPDDAKFGTEGAQQAKVGIGRAKESGGVGLFKHKMSFYH